jgi:PAS domain S-box-containing protein
VAGRGERVSGASPGSDLSPGWLAGLRTSVAVSALAVALIGALVLAGWFLHIAALISLLPNSATMKPNTATLFVLLGSAVLILLRAPVGPAHALARGIAGVVILVAVLTLVEYAGGVDLGIDQRLIRDPSSNGRMAAATAVCFLLLGTATVFLRTRVGHRPVSLLLVLFPALIAVVVLLGYLYNVPALYRLGFTSSIALHTAILFALLVFSIAFADPHLAPVSTLVSRGIGGTMVRRLLPVAILAPALLGWLRLMGQRAGLYGTEYGVAIEIGGTMLVLVVVIWVIGRQLDRVDADRLIEQRNYRVIFENNPLPMAFVGLKDRTLLEVNNATLAAYGYTRQEFQEINPTDIFVPDENMDLEAFRRVTSSGKDMVRAGPINHRNKNGAVMRVLVTSHQVMFGTRPARFVVIEDVTERERLERQASQSQRLESLGQLAGGVAHDFNNLLGVILNFAMFAKEKIAAVDGGADRKSLEAAGKDIDKVIRAGQSAAALTHQLLAFGRREVIRARPLQINSVVTELTPLLRRTIGEHIQMTTSLADDLWMALMDPGQLEQVISNLCVNARDAMPDGGKLIVATENVAVDQVYASGRPGLKPGNYVCLRITDTGTGMDEQTLQRVFEPFFTTKEKGHGTGLGLATVHGIVNQVGGYISIYSEPGVGTRVNVLLPATERIAVPAQEPPAAPDVVATGGTVLLVEDAEDLREVAERILSRNGYVVITAADGPAAIKAAAENRGRIDLLLTDVVMPHMQGPELAAKIAESHPDIRVIYMSGYAQPILGAKGTLAPGIDLIDKPFTEAVLLARVRHALARPDSSPVIQ